VKFTYFISAVYFVSRADRKLYDAPGGKGLGRSAIGWGGKPEENGGAYWNAMFRFAEEVCGLSEVQCVTYSELADFMDLLTPEQIAAYQKGEFESVLSPSTTTQASLVTADWCHNQL
jgi:hypothetical protein